MEYNSFANWALKSDGLDYPNPLMRREEYTLLDDGWEFSMDGHGWQPIRVPFCPQSELSGICYTGFIRSCFYRKTFCCKVSAKRTVLHFGAVDYRAVLYLNGKYVGTHTGGYTPFSFDITPWLQDGENKIELTVYDENKNIASGKQSYKLKSFGCFYTRTTGIWQSVWLESTPKEYIREFYFYPNIDSCSVDVELLTSCSGEYEILVLYDGRPVGCATGSMKYKTRVCIPLEEKHLWDLGQGKLYDVLIRFCSDEVASYFGLRKVEYKDKHFFLNGREVFQKLVLDQGFYPDGIYTAPSKEAMEKDIALGMQLGFNGARLHQKVFEPRFLSLCDRAGYMVWGEFPSWGIDYSNLDGLGQFLAEWQEVLKRDFNHPAIIHWCPLNEVWGDWEDCEKRPDIRFAEIVYEITKRFDSTRPCVDVSGGFHSSSTDVYDFHCYESEEKLKEYLDSLEQKGVLEVPLLSCDGLSSEYAGQPVILSEYGGSALKNNIQENTVCAVNEGAVQSEKAWGYGRGEEDGDAFVEQYCRQTKILQNCRMLAGYCYTQLYDVEQESNGFYYYDRSDKLTDKQKEKIRSCQQARM